MANQHISCTVNTCYYWDTPQVCKAEHIMVKFNPDVIHGSKMEVGSMDEKDAHNTSAGTLCETFVPKDHGPKNGIKKLP